MRMWMTNPIYMCDNHLRQEHVDVHAIALRVIEGRATEDLIAEPMSVQTRHSDLEQEMIKRGMEHKTPMPKIICDSEQFIWGAHALAELLAECKDCRERILKNGMDSESSGS